MDRTIHKESEKTTKEKEINNKFIISLGPYTGLKKRERLKRDLIE